MKVYQKAFIVSKIKMTYNKCNNNNSKMLINLQMQFKKSKKMYI